MRIAIMKGWLINIVTQKGRTGRKTINLIGSGRDGFFGFNASQSAMISSMTASDRMISGFFKGTP